MPDTKEKQMRAALCDLKKTIDAWIAEHNAVPGYFQLNYTVMTLPITKLCQHEELDATKVSHLAQVLPQLETMIQEHILLAMSQIYELGKKWFATTNTQERDSLRNQAEAIADEIHDQVEALLAPPQNN